MAPEKSHNDSLGCVSFTGKTST